jgi:hypothetical protein
VDDTANPVFPLRANFARRHPDTARDRKGWLEDCAIEQTQADRFYYFAG